MAAAVMNVLAAVLALLVLRPMRLRFMSASCNGAAALRADGPFLSASHRRNGMANFDVRVV